MFTSSAIAERDECVDVKVVSALAPSRSISLYVSILNGVFQHLPVFVEFGRDIGDIVDVGHGDLTSSLQMLSEVLLRQWCESLEEKRSAFYV